MTPEDALATLRDAAWERAAHIRRQLDRLHAAHPDDPDLFEPLAAHAERIEAALAATAPPQCVAFKRNGERCRNQPMHGSDRCGPHEEQRQ